MRRCLHLQDHHDAAPVVIATLILTLEDCHLRSRLSADTRPCFPSSIPWFRASSSRPIRKKWKLTRLATIQTPRSKPTVPTSTKNTDRPLVLYAYAESENARQNLEFFLEKGIHGRADFIFIFNGATTASQLIPQRDNIRVVQRENTCFDLGGIGEVLMKDNVWKKYKRFITMNASIRGPFLPMYSDACWTDVFLGRVTDHVKVNLSLSMLALYSNLAERAVTLTTCNL